MKFLLIIVVLYFFVGVATATMDFLQQAPLLDEEFTKLVPFAESTSDGSLSVASLSEMKLHATLSAASYCIGFNVPNLSDWSCKTCKSSGIAMTSTSVWQFSSSGLGTFVGYDKTKGVIRVVFRGSANWANWQANLNIIQTPFNCPGSSGCVVHSGFKSAWLSARNSVVTKLTALRNTYKTAPIQISGHSLGGAVAVLAFIDLNASVFSIHSVDDPNGETFSVVSSTMFPSEVQFSQEEFALLGMKTEHLSTTFSNISQVTTFGQPRVFNSNGAAYFAKVANSKYTRVTHSHDIVPRIPIVASNYLHSSTEVYFPQDDLSYKSCSTTNGEDKNCAAGNILSLSIKDHKLYVGVSMSQDATTCGK